MAETPTECLAGNQALQRGAWLEARTAFEAALAVFRSRGANLREVDLPLLFPALLVGAVFAFTVSLGEFGATLLIYPPDYPTVPVVIGRLLGRPGAANYGQALALSTILMLITGVSFMLLERVRYRDVGEF